MKKSKHVFYVMIACVAFVIFGGRVFGAEDQSNTKMFLSVIKLKDEKGVTGSAEEMRKRFALQLDNPVSGKRSGVESVDGGIAQVIGEINKDTTFKVTYTYPGGGTVDVVGKINAWKQGNYPVFLFSPPVKEGDDKSEKNVFKVSLKVYDDPDPEFKGIVQNGLLEVTMVN